MDRLQTLRGFVKEWEQLLVRTTAAKTLDTSLSPPSDDPFDCCALENPPVFNLAEQVAEEYVQRWRDLDQRKVRSDGGYRYDAVVDGCGSTTADDGKDEDTNSDNGNFSKNNSNNLRKNTKKRKTIPAWFEKRVRLPDQFDYATHQDKPPQDDGSGDRVVSLEGSVGTTSYHTELWKLFRQIPTQQDMEMTALEGHGLHHSIKVREAILAAGSSNAVDTFGLARFRMSDRHDLPQFHETATAAPENAWCGTLRLEFWRRPLQRGSLPDPNRMDLEFLGTQPLLDVQRAIEELAGDDLWANNHQRKNHDGDLTDDGFFFIEGNFYTAGSTDCVPKIVSWLETEHVPCDKSRQAYLGVPEDSSLSIKSITDTSLEDIAMRLGFRYLYTFHGDVEIALYLTDRNIVPTSSTKTNQYPIIHDIWTNVSTNPDCDLCQYRSGTIATASTCEATGGHRVLCEGCCRQLKLASKEPDKIRLYSEWINEGNLSTSAAEESFSLL
jgi:snRNA-activating protein complex (SNAPc), subunit 3